MKSNLSIKTVLSQSWQSVKSNLKFFILLSLLLFGIQILQSVISGALVNPSLVYSFVSILFSLINAAVTLGLIHLSLKYLSLNTASFSDLIAKLSYFWTYLLSSIYYGLIVIAGLILFIIPGIIWALRYQFFGYAIVDQGLGPKAALQKSKEITQGHLGKLFLFGLALLGLNLLGVLALLAGLLVTVPMSLLATAKVYRILSTGQPVSPSPAPPPAGGPTNVWKTYRQS